MVGGVDQVAGQRQLEAAADRHAVDGGDHRLVEVGQLLQPAEAADAVVAVDRSPPAAAFRSQPAQKNLSPPPVTMATRSPGSSRKAAKRSPISRCGAVDGVGLWPVERDLEDAVGRRGPDCLAHAFVLRCKSNQTSRRRSCTLALGRTISGIDVEFLDRVGMRQREARHRHRRPRPPPRHRLPGRPRKPCEQRRRISGRAVPPRRRRRSSAGSRSALSARSSTSTPPEPERQHKPEHRVAGDADDQLGDAVGHHRARLEAGAQVRHACGGGPDGLGIAQVEPHRAELALVGDAARRPSPPPGSQAPPPLRQPAAGSSTRRPPGCGTPCSARRRLPCPRRA